MLCRRDWPVVKSSAEYAWYGSKSFVTWGARKLYGGAEVICSSLRSILRYPWSIIKSSAEYAWYWSSNGGNNTKRFFSRGWYNNSLFKYYDRSEEIVMLFQDPNRFADDMPDHIGYDRNPKQHVTYGQLIPTQQTI